jgi:transcriptional regulator with XRE-family HTH domain
MTGMNTGKPVDRAWLQRMADAEDQCESVSVGGLAHELGNLRPTQPEQGSMTQVAFGKLVELSRRQLGLNREELAQKADIDVAELLGIERAKNAKVEPRTVFKLSQVLRLPPTRLMELAGLAVRSDRRLDDAAVRFAACSEPVDRLSPDEQRALQEFVQTLASLSD